jgi:hypothetical protein
MQFFEYSNFFREKMKNDVCRCTLVVIMLPLLAESSCATLPTFDSTLSPQKIGPKVSDIIDDVQCEILSSVHNGKNDPSLFGDGAEYVANVNLTLDVTDDNGINSSLAYVLPYGASTGFMGAITPQISGVQHRNFNETFTLVFSKNTPINAMCNDSDKGIGIKGNLGLAEIISTGLPYSTGYKYGSNYPYLAPAINVNTYLYGNDPLTNSSALVPAFGSTVDFTLVYGIGGAPNWTITHFSGPSPSGGGSLISLMRTSKDTLVVSFARVQPANGQSGTEGSTRDEQVGLAAKAAVDNSTRMILQSLFP